MRVALAGQRARVFAAPRGRGRASTARGMGARASLSRADSLARPAADLASTVRAKQEKLGEYSRLAQRLGSDFLSQGRDPEDPLLGDESGVEAIAFRDEMRQAGEVESLLAAMGDANERLAVAADASPRGYAARLNPRARGALRFLERVQARAERSRGGASRPNYSRRAGGRRRGGGGKSATGHLMDESKSIQNSLTSTGRARAGGGGKNCCCASAPRPGRSAAWAVAEAFRACGASSTRSTGSGSARTVLGTVIGVLICVCLWYVLFGSVCATGKRARAAVSAPPAAPRWGSRG